MLILPAILQSFRSKVDKTFTIIFSTNELTPEQSAALAGSLMQFGYCCFKVDAFKKQETDAIEALEADYEDIGKTPGQRLRGVLYVNFKNDNQGFDTFSKYYDWAMEKIIIHYKSKLP